MAYSILKTHLNNLQNLEKKLKLYKTRLEHPEIWKEYNDKFSIAWTKTRQQEGTDIAIPYSERRHKGGISNTSDNPFK